MSIGGTTRLHYQSLGHTDSRKHNQTCTTHRLHLVRKSCVSTFCDSVIHTETIEVFYHTNTTRTATERATATIVLEGFFAQAPAPVFRVIILDTGSSHFSRGPKCTAPARTLSYCSCTPPFPSQTSEATRLPRRPADSSAVSTTGGSAQARSRLYGCAVEEALFHSSFGGEGRQEGVEVGGVDARVGV